MILTARNYPKWLGMEALWIPFTGTKEMRQLLKTTPHHTPNYLEQCNQTSTVLMATIKPRLILWIVKWRNMIRHSGEYISTALESSSSLLYTTASKAWHCAWWCKAWLHPFHKAYYALSWSEGHIKFRGLSRLTLQKVGDLCALRV